MAVVVAALLPGCRPQHPAPRTVTLLAHEYGYQMPDSIPAGVVRLELHNRGQDVHEGLLVRFTNPGGSAAAYVDSVRADVFFPAFAEDWGGPGLALPGDSSAVWIQLVEGHYGVVCWKGDHLVQGMAHDLVVTAGSGSAASPPTADAELSLREFAFGLQTPLSGGRQVLHVKNEGTEPHEADIFRLGDGATVQDYIGWLKDGEKGLSPVRPVGGLGDISPGREVWISLDLPPGRYFLICQVPAAADGKPHFEHGMLWEFTIS